MSDFMHTGTTGTYAGHRVIVLHGNEPEAVPGWNIAGGGLVTIEFTPSRTTWARDVISVPTSQVTTA